MTEPSLTRRGPSGLSPEADEALAVITALCGGQHWCKIIGRDTSWIEIDAYSSDDGEPRLITIGIDGRVMHT